MEAAKDTGVLTNGGSPIHASREAIISTAVLAVQDATIVILQFAEAGSPAQDSKDAIMSAAVLAVQDATIGS
jgi:hypothetical protein